MMHVNPLIHTSFQKESKTKVLVLKTFFFFGGGGGGERAGQTRYTMVSVKMVKGNCPRAPPFRNLAIEDTN